MEILKLYLEGLLSFFSPCILPLVPLYIGYLTQDAKVTAENGTVTYRRGRTLFLTVGFCLGISTVFVIAALGSTALHAFFIQNTLIFQLTGGILLIFFSLVSLHIINIPFLNQTHAHAFKANGGMSFLKAFLMGFFFSFAWSPCIGPLLAQAIVKAATASGASTGWIYIASYAAGFISIFLLLGFFTTEVLNLLKKYKKVVKYTGIIAGLIVMFMGFWTLGQAVQTYNASIASVNSAVTSKTEAPSPAPAAGASASASASPTASSAASPEAPSETGEQDSGTAAQENPAAAEDTSSQAGTDSGSATSSQPAAATPAPVPTPTPAPTPEPSTDINTYDFTLSDSAGNAVTLSSYRGKTIIVNFFGTWCYYCNEELPGLQNIHDSNANVEIILVAAPNVNGEGDIAYVENYMKSKGYSMRIVYDTSLTVTKMYYISGYPTSFIYKPDGSIYGYIPGYVAESQLNQYLQEASN